MASFSADLTLAAYPAWTEAADGSSTETVILQVKEQGGVHVALADDSGDVTGYFVIDTNSPSAISTATFNALTTKVYARPAGSFGALEITVGAY